MEDNQELAFEQEETALEKRDEQPEDFEEKLQRAISEERTQIVTLLKHLKPYHWEKFGDNYRLNRRGAEYILKLAGMSLTLSKPILTELDDGHYLYAIKATVIDKIGRHTEYYGDCDSYDKFIGTNNDATDDKGKIRKPVQKVDRTNIIRKAQANAVSNAAGRFFGIQSIPAEEFEGIFEKAKLVKEAKFRT